MATNTEKIVVQVVVKGQGELEKLNKGTKKATGSFASLTKGTAAMAGGILAAAAAFRKISQTVSQAIRTFTKFEFEMAKVRAITGSTDKDFKKLSATAQQLGKTTFFTASQVAELQVNFGKLGFSTQEILAAQEATLLLATATQSDLGRAAIVAGAAVRGFALDASETARVVDVMALAFTSSALDIEKFQTSMTKVSPISAAANISLEATTAVMGTLTDAGIEASIAGTSLRNIFLKMADPASDLSQHLGFTVNSTEDLEKALVTLNSESLSNAEMMELVDLRQVAAFATMVNGVDNIQDLIDAFNDASGAAQEMSDIMADTLQGDILKAKSAWEGFTIALFEGSNKISNTIRNILQNSSLVLNAFADSLKDADQKTQDLVSNISKNVTDALKEVDKFEQSGVAEEFQMKASKTKVELYDEEINKLKEKTKELTVSIKKEEDIIEKGHYLRRVAAKTRKEEKQEELLVNRNAINELKIIRDKELEHDKKREELRLLEIQIQNKKNDRAKEKKAKEDLAEEERIEKERLKLQQDKFRAAKDAEKIDFEQEQNIEKEKLKYKIITQEQFDTNMFILELAHLENMKDINIQYGEDVAFINGKILDLELNRIQTVAEAEAKKNADAKKDREDQIKDLDQLGKSLITMAGEEKKLQGIKKLGIKVTAAATLATNLETIANAKNAIAKAATEKFPASLIAIVSVLAAMLSAAKSAQTITEFANGGMVEGKSHAQGGEKFAVGGRVVELEGGEAVINKRSTSMFKNQLSAMNAAGGGVKFADGGLMNMPSFAQSQFSATSQAGMMGAIGQGGKVVVVESDISTVQNTVSVIEAEATI